MLDFSQENIRSWKQFYDSVSKLGDLAPHTWIFRGQTNDWTPSTAIERVLLGWDFALSDATDIEYQTIREFRRRIKDPFYQQVHSDTLACLALMQHHGAPTRLLDCTYSPFVAAAFAIQNGFVDTEPVIWCFRGAWCEDAAKEATEPETFVEQRNNDHSRTDATFLPLYQLKNPNGAESSRKQRFVKPENPLHLNERLTTQQGVFLCPADLRTRFIDNLKAMRGWDSNNNIVKLRLNLERDPALEFARNLRSMNLSFAALFPGFDGFPRSIGQQIFHYAALAIDKVGG
jgi:hypothetical protein